MSLPLRQIWADMLVHLRAKHPSLCRHWFDQIEPVQVEGGTLQLLVRQEVQLRYLRRSCTAEFGESAQAVTGHLLAVQFIGEHEEAGEIGRASCRERVSFTV